MSPCRRTWCGRAAEAAAPAWIAGQLAMLQGSLPDVPVGPHCSTPYDCPFWARCWPALPAHHVSTLYRIKEPRAAELDAQGYRLIAELPEGVPLHVIQERQRRAVRDNRIVVEPTLAEALALVAAPIAFLDFETVG